jgi:hypothetical protein
VPPRSWSAQTTRLLATVRKATERVKARRGRCAGVGCTVNFRWPSASCPAEVDLVHPRVGPLHQGSASVHAQSETGGEVTVVRQAL